MIASAPMTVRDAMERYYLPQAVGLAPRTHQTTRYRVTAWERVISSTVEQITSDDFVRFRAHCLDLSQSPATIESTISIVLTILRACEERGSLRRVPRAGHRLKRRTPSPKIPRLTSLGPLWNHCHVALWPIGIDKIPFWRRWIACSYTTALRLEDQIFLRSSSVQDDAVTVTAKKTKKVHRIPIHPVFTRQLNAESKTDRVFDIPKSSAPFIRRELRRICRAAGVPKVTPQEIRRLSVCEWERARPGCGALIQGSGINGSLAYYLDPSLPLFEAIASLAIPDEWLTSADRKSRRSTETTLLRSFRKLQDSDRQVVLRFSQSLSTRPVTG